jgi:hypothetical protein
MKQQASPVTVARASALPTAHCRRPTGDPASPRSTGGWRAFAVPFSGAVPGAFVGYNSAVDTRTHLQAV